MLTTNERLQAELNAAVAAATPGMRKVDLVRKFQGRGVSDSSLYAWIDRAQNAAALTIVRNQDRVANAMAGRQAGTAPVEPIQFQSLLSMVLDDLKALRGMARAQDGRIINPRLMLETADKISRTLDRAARIGAIIQDMQAQTDYLAAISEVIHQEEPAVRDRILGAMRDRGLL